MTNNNIVSAMRKQVLFENIPAELRSLPRWVVWRYEYRENDPKPTKIPYCSQAICERDIHAPRASSTDPSTWTTFDQAVAAYKSGTSMDGIGIMLNGEHIAGIDLDECIENGTLVFWAEDIVRKMASYTEVSPSGKGIRIF